MVPRHSRFRNFKSKNQTRIMIPNFAKNVPQDVANFGFGTLASICDRPQFFR